MMLGRVTVTLAILATFVSQGASYVRVCYFTSWSPGRPQPLARISLDEIDVSLCTHVAYAFADIDVPGRTLVVDNARFIKFNKIKQRNPSLKTLLSTGGANAAATTKFEQISVSNTTIHEFSKNVAQLLRQYGFDGLDVDWEYPTSGTKSKLTALIKGLWEEFDRSEREHLIVSAAVAAGEHIVTPGYDIPHLSRYLEYILIMTYDFSGTWSDVTGFDSPLFNRSDPNFSPVYNVDYAVKMWLKGGADPGQVVVGTTGAGASFTLRDPNNHGVGAPVVKGGGPPGGIFQLKGRLIYPEICEKLSKGWTRVWDEQQQVPYAYSGLNWVGYDDPQSFTRKAEYIKSKDLGGIMFWELSFDDPHEVCNQGKFPLLTAARTVLDSTFTTTTLSPTGTSDISTKGNSSPRTTTLPSTKTGMSTKGDNSTKITMMSPTSISDVSTKHDNSNGKASTYSLDIFLYLYLVMCSFLFT